MSLRIQKFLSQCGYCSRRKAEALIKAFRVTVNDNPAVLGQTVDALRDRICVDAVHVHPMPQRETVVLMLNKPRGVICTHRIQAATEKTVFHFIPHPWNRERFLYCGRLDKDSQGMLILTNDGDFAHQLTHPSANIIKIYRVTLSRPIAEEHKAQMLRGIEDRGEVLKAEKIFELPQNRGHQVLEIHLRQGRNREIRRMVETVGGCHVHRLKRIQIGQLKLKNLAVGAIKYLTPSDRERLFS
ncbi:MAG: rRNA pseudouridine synthase [Puniceicoccales bacterium]|jgi:23S rRNA pseudouridine2605 synthase|nr:rRNA pseudouridine synthase [Puniceicoccales bacterium]